MNNVCVRRLDAFYGKTQILSDISLSAEAGRCTFLTGPNGSGKSTLLAVLAGIDVPGLICGAGKKSPPVTLDGEPLASFSRKALSRRIAFMPQHESIVWNYTVRDVILAGRYAHTGFFGSYAEADYAAARRAAAELELEPLLDRSVTTLSGGEFQRVRIARALAQEPGVLLLDEPAANLDFTFRFCLLDTIRRLARRKNLTVVVSIHDLDLAAAFADVLALLSPIGRARENGAAQLCTGTPESVLTPDLLYRAYGKKFGVYTHPAYGCPTAFVVPSQ